MCALKSLRSRDGHTLHAQFHVRSFRHRRGIERGPWQNIIYANEKYTKPCSVFFKNPDTFKEIDQTQKNENLHEGEVGGVSGNEWYQG